MRRNPSPSSMRRVEPRRGRAIALGLGVLVGTLVAAVPTHAQTVQAQKAAASAGKQTATSSDKMILEAAEVRYDIDKNLASAVGNVHIYHQGRVLEADKVIYDRNAGRVYAEGHAKLTEADGTILRGERLEFTDDFRDGFIDSMQAEAPDRAYFSSPHAERIELDTTVYDKGTYTACSVCRTDPERPPLWRVRAKRIIHKNDEKMLYYEDAGLDFLGISTPYMPFFSSPDPSVKRKSGLLMPNLVYGQKRGVGVGIPIFFALAPNYDLTLTPTYLSQQGFFGKAEWRHRFDYGQYYIRANGIAQQDRAAFAPPPYGAGDRVFRGSFESKGQIQLADYWKTGWDFTLLTDRWFLYDYHVPTQNLSYYYFGESISTAYLTGQGGRGYFDLRGYYINGLSSHDFQPQQAIARPVWDYNRTFDIDPAATLGIGGEVGLDFNLTSLSAQSASFEAVGPRILDNAYGLYEICQNYVPGQAVGNCLLRGLGGDYTRTTAIASYKRKWIDPIGQVWTPFAFGRFNGEWFDIDQTRSYTFTSASGTSTFTNASQVQFVGNKDTSFFGAVVPGIGLEYRYPFLVTPSVIPGLGSIVAEPIGQIIARPDRQIGARSLVNLDAQSLVFDNSTLFAWDKYSGYDRFETGTRANYGGRLTWSFDNGSYINAAAGQSYQVAGTNSYATPDAANVGLSSGLDTRLSDYVGSLTIVPGSLLTFTAKSRFDVNTFEPRRIDLVSTFNLGALTAVAQYANYSAQPVIGYDVRREGLSFYTRYQISENYFASGNVTFDMSRQFYSPNLIGTSNPGAFFPAYFGVGAGYEDECTKLTINYNSIYSDLGNGRGTRNQVFLVQLQLRTLGDEKFVRSAAATSGPSIDGYRN
jgi:LPS-assembly protein